VHLQKTSISIASALFCETLAAAEQEKKGGKCELGPHMTFACPQYSGDFHIMQNGSFDCSVFMWC